MVRRKTMKKPRYSTSNNELEAIFEGKKCILSDAQKEYQVEMSRIPSCTRQCPAGINVKSYIRLIANRKFEEAIDVIREANAFPAVCGRVCTRPCEEYCELGVNGDPLAIRDLKRFAADYER